MDLILDVVVMRGRTDNELFTPSCVNASIFMRQKCGRSGRQGPNKVEALLIRRKEGREQVVEFMDANSIGARKGWVSVRAASWV